MLLGRLRVRLPLLAGCDMRSQFQRHFPGPFPPSRVQLSGRSGSGSLILPLSPASVLPLIPGQEGVILGGDLRRLGQHLAAFPVGMEIVAGAEKPTRPLGGGIEHAVLARIGTLVGYAVSARVYLDTRTRGWRQPGLT